MGAEDTLARVPLFQDLNKKSLNRIAKTIRTRSFKAGDTIFREGEEGVGFFIVAKGKAEATRSGTALATYGPDDFFGEMALLDNHRRSATVKALEDTECMAIMRSDFLAEVRNNPDLAIEILAVMSKRIRNLDERLAHS